jgi:hypothetical protein
MIKSNPLQMTHTPKPKTSFVSLNILEILIQNYLQETFPFSTHFHNQTKDHLPNIQWKLGAQQPVV